MSKYSKETKLEVVKYCIEGNHSSYGVSKKFKIPDNTNLILHSNQGCQYQIKQYQTMLENKSKLKGMSPVKYRKHSCLEA